MALIKCPSCGEEISDKATRCIHCGWELSESKKVLCPECGTEIPEGAEACPKCGCPVEKEKAQKVEVTRVKVSKKAVISIVVAVVVVIVAIFGGLKVKEASEQKAAAEAVEAYNSNLSTITYDILQSAAYTESLTSLIHDVWYNTIYEKDDTTTDEYTKTIFGSFNDDFNTSLAALFVSPRYTDDVDKIEADQEKIQSDMKELMNPPEECKEAYSVLKEYYDAYIELCNCATNPTGNLTSYTEDCNDADTKASNCYQKMQLYIGE